MIRKLMVVGIATPFAILCVHDLWCGRLKTGVLAGLFCVSNIIVYW